MPNTAASCCNSSSGSGASDPRATVCRETVVRTPATAPAATQPVIFSFWPIMSGCPCRRLSNQYTQLGSNLFAGVPRGDRHAGVFFSALALRSHRGGGLFGGCGIAEVVVAQGLQVVVQF